MNNLVVKIEKSGNRYNAWDINGNKYTSQISIGARKKAYDNGTALEQRVNKAGKNVVWTCDPMHGNTIKSNTGFKTRPLKDIISEIQQFFQIHRGEGTYPGGVHLEMTGQDVTECMGGLQEITDEDLKNRYHTYCDPRLNASQSLELAFLLSDFLKEEKLLSKQSSNL